MSDPSFKTKAWLRPAAWIYDTFTGIRNRMYEKGILSSYSAPFAVICIGNITAGGTGKTPHSEYLASLLADKYPTAILSRGYGRDTKGYYVVETDSDPRHAGDEPCQMRRKNPNVTVAVCENRVEGLQKLEEFRPEVVIMDDGMQHRAVKASLNIMLVNWNRNILDDRPIPEGLLRESAEGRYRADIIIVSKCPESITEEQMDTMKERLRLNVNQRLFFTGLEYGSLKPFDEDGRKAKPLDSIKAGSRILVATGIASPELIVKTLSCHTQNISTIRFPDHHRFSERDMKRIETMLKDWRPEDMVVITEKDAVKMMKLDIPQRLAQMLWILPVRVRFVRGKEEFDRIVVGHIDNFNNKRRGKD